MTSAAREIFKCLLPGVFATVALGHPCHAIPPRLAALAILPQAASGKRLSTECARALSLPVVSMFRHWAASINGRSGSLTHPRLRGL